MKRKIKLLSLLPLFGIAITAPIIATSCSNKQTTQSETIPSETIKPVIAKGNEIKVSYKVVYNSGDKYDPPTTIQVDVQGIVSYVGDTYFTLLVDNKARNIHNDWLISVELIQWAK